MTGLLKKTGICFFICFLISACAKEGSKGDPDPDLNKDRKAVLTHIADNIVIPAYADFKVKFDLMSAKSLAFTSQPGPATLADFRLAWKEAYIEWQKVELFDFGPGARTAMRNYFNIYPASVQGINTYINNPSENIEVSSAYDKQGFPALDYLLNGVGTTDSEIVSWYTVPTEGPKRIAFVKRIIAHMESLLTKVSADWKGTYYAEFTNKTGTDIGSPTGELVNGFVLHYERYIRSGKFGIPSGAMLNGTVSADRVEAVYSRTLAKTLAQTAHQAAVDFFNGKNVKTGTEGPSLKSYLNSLEAKDNLSGKLLSEIINTQFTAGKSKIDALGPDLYQQVLSNNQAMKDTYNELQKMVRILKVDMTSAMSITITYTDNDGD